MPSEMFKNGLCQGCIQFGIDGCPLHGLNGEFARYDINVMQGNTDGKAPIVIVPTSNLKPTYGGFFGEAVGEITPGGGLRFSHPMIYSGACHLANGGYLVVKVNELLLQPMWPFIVQQLVNAIKNKSITIDDVPTSLGVPHPMGRMPQKAEAIPLNLRLILIGDEMQYHALQQAEGILHLFRVVKLKAQMEPDIPRTTEAIHQYVGFIKYYCKRKNFLMPDREAVRELIDYSSYCAQHQEKLTLRRQEIKLLLGEADFFARQRGASEIQRQDIEKVLEEKRRQLNWVEERMQARIFDNTFKIDTAGAKNGQINALAVFSTGDHTFGLPHRITANVYLGKGDVVSIDREATLALEIHNKGLGILTGYFKETFGQKFPLAFGASLVFEQSYGKIDGDSASSTELYALLSKFAEAPIKQAIAVTGSVNQRGEVQPIGGVNYKIAGWFKTCKARGLTGEQGVLIPEANAKDLMLDKEIVEAVREGKFHIWTVSHISEGIELLTGLPFGNENYEGDCIFKRVEKRLRQMAENVRNFMKPSGA
jgi:predicted ATP-dependent protease